MSTTSKVRLATDDALIVTDIQHDFLPGGRLAMLHGEEDVIRPIDVTLGERATGEMLQIGATPLRAEAIAA